jgi:hypothetical protein
VLPQDSPHNFCGFPASCCISDIPFHNVTCMGNMIFMVVVDGDAGYRKRHVVFLIVTVLVLRIESHSFLLAVVDCIDSFLVGGSDAISSLLINCIIISVTLAFHSFVHYDNYK